MVAAALELSDEDQETYLAEVCADDHELRAEVEDLLAGRSGAADFLESAVRGPIDETTSNGPLGEDPLFGSVIGSYRVESLIGAGGMGAVYLATRADQEYEQQVAIKLLHAGMAGNDMARRFRAERQFLAMLEHPNIAGMHDSGSTGDGRPYLVMEYVEGKPLDRYCEEHGLGVRDRIRLFLKICDAVTFAHRNLVVHRDLKPGNILVTEEGEPKLLDFGIAKLLDPALMPDGHELTRTGMRPMSPQFASPEQIRGLPITTASDVYSLGVVLYELLAGELPHHFEDYSAASMERELAREPTAPSVAVSAGNAPEGPRIRRQLAGDLDAIVLKALRDEPEHRYPAVDDLGDDLRRHLEGLPVKARRGGLAYRAGKMIRRHKVTAIMSALVAGLILSFSIAVVGEQRRTTRERDRAERIADFMVGVFEQASPDLSGDGTISARGVLERGAGRIEEEFSDFPETQADLLLTVGQVYAHLGMFLDAVPLLRRSVELREEIGGAESPELPEAMNQLSYALIELGAWDEALPLLDRALAIGERELGEEHEEYVASLKLMGQLHWRRSEPAKAVPYYRRALELSERIFGPNDPKTAQAMGELAIDLTELGEFDEAERLHLRANEIFENAIEPFPAEHATSLSCLGVLYWETGRLTEAAHHLELSLEMHEQIALPDDSTIGSTLNNLALIQADRGELEKATSLLRRSLEIKLRGLEENSPAVLATRNNLASVALEFGRLEEALSEWTEVLEECRVVFAPDSERTAKVLRSMAVVEHFLGRDLEAQKHLRESSGILERSFDEHHPGRIRSMGVDAQIQLATRNTAGAERLLRHVVSQADAASSLPEVWQIHARGRLVEALITTGHLDEAAEHLDRAEVLVANLTETEPSASLTRLAARLQINRGDLLEAQENPVQAQEAWERALVLLDPELPGSMGADHRLLRLAALLRLGRPEEARPDAEELIALGWQRPGWIRLALSGATQPDHVPVILF